MCRFCFSTPACGGQRAIGALQRAWSPQHKIGMRGILCLTFGLEIGTMMPLTGTGLHRFARPGATPDMQRARTLAEQIQQNGTDAVRRQPRSLCSCFTHVHSATIGIDPNPCLPIFADVPARTETFSSGLCRICSGCRDFVGVATLPTPRNVASPGIGFRRTSVQPVPVEGTFPCDCKPVRKSH